MISNRYILSASLSLFISLPFVTIVFATPPSVKLMNQKKLVRLIERRNMGTPVQEFIWEITPQLIKDAYEAGEMTPEEADVLFSVHANTQNAGSLLKQFRFYDPYSTTSIVLGVLFLSSIATLILLAFIAEITTDRYTYKIWNAIKVNGKWGTIELVEKPLGIGIGRYGRSGENLFLPFNPPPTPEIVAQVAKLNKYLWIGRIVIPCVITLLVYLLHVIHRNAMDKKLLLYHFLLERNLLQDLSEAHPKSDALVYQKIGDWIEQDYKKGLITNTEWQWFKTEWEGGKNFWGIMADLIEAQVWRDNFKQRLRWHEWLGRKGIRIPYSREELLSFARMELEEEDDDDDDDE